MKTGERIKTIRKSQGITQAKLAETLHISSSFMSRIENGSSSLTLDFVCEIADATSGYTPRSSPRCIYLY